MSLDRKTLVLRIDAVLQPLGFSRQGMTWRRNTASVIEIVAVQISKALDAFTVNLGVLDPAVYTACWGEPPSGRGDEAACTVRARLGMLAPGKDQWWDTTDHAALHAVEATLCEFGLPFLSAHQSSVELEQALETSRDVRQPYPPPVIYWAILTARNGNRDAACSILMNLHERTTDAWQPRIEAVRARLGCV